MNRRKKNSSATECRRRWWRNIFKHVIYVFCFAAQSLDMNCMWCVSCLPLCFGCYLCSSSRARTHTFDYSVPNAKIRQFFCFVISQMSLDVRQCENFFHLTVRSASIRFHWIWTLFFTSFFLSFFVVVVCYGILAHSQFIVTSLDYCA